MQVTTANVVSGKVIVEGAPLREGSLVAVVARSADASFSLSAAQEEELVAAMAEIQGGEFVSLEEVLESLPNPGLRKSHG